MLISDHSVRTDPVILRAATIWGGVPPLDVEDVGGDLDENISAYLMDKASTWYIIEKILRRILTFFLDRLIWV